MAARWRLPSGFFEEKEAEEEEEEEEEEVEVEEETINVHCKYYSSDG